MALPNDARAVPAKLRPGYELKDDRIVGQTASPDPAHPLERQDRLQRPAVVPHALHDGCASRTSKDRCFSASSACHTGHWLMSSAEIRCSGTARSAGWAGSVSWGPPYVGRSASPNIFWPTNTISRWTERRCTSPRRSAAGCCLGAEPSAAAGTDQLKVAYAVFKEEALDVAPTYAPKTVSTDGWQGTQAAWKALFKRVVILLCFLHGWLKIRDRAKHLKEQFTDISRLVWDAYHAPNRRGFGQRLRRLREWAGTHLSGVVQENVLDLCRKGRRYAVAYRYPGGHRTSNMLDRQMRGMNRYFDQGQHLHGSLGACRLHCRAWALLWNFRHGIRRPHETITAGAARPSDSTSTATTRVGCRICWYPRRSEDTDIHSPKKRDGQQLHPGYVVQDEVKRLIVEDEVNINGGNSHLHRRGELSEPPAWRRAGRSDLRLT